MQAGTSTQLVRQCSTVISVVTCTLTRQCSRDVLTALVHGHAPLARRCSPLPSYTQLLICVLWLYCAAVTMAFLISKKVTLLRAFAYWFCQLTGAILGSSFVYAVRRPLVVAATDGLITTAEVLPSSTPTAQLTL